MSNIVEPANGGAFSVSFTYISSHFNKNTPKTAEMCIVVFIHPHRSVAQPRSLKQRFKNFKFLQNDPRRTFHSTISFKRDKNKGSFQVRSARKSDDQPIPFKCMRARYNTCPFTFTTQVKYLDPSKLLKSLIILIALQQISVIFFFFFFFFF